MLDPNLEKDRQEWIWSERIWSRLNKKAVDVMWHKQPQETALTQMLDRQREND